MAATRKKKTAKKKTSSKAAPKAAKRKAAARPAKPAKKVAARKPAKKKAPRKQIVGEGDYAASRTFLRDQANFVKKNKARIPELGKAAEAALEGPEGASLRVAEAKARRRSKAPPGGETMEGQGVLVIPPG